MTLLTVIVTVLLVIAVIWIAVDRVTAWLVRRGGITIRIESNDDGE